MQLLAPSRRLCGNFQCARSIREAAEPRSKAARSGPRTASRLLCRCTIATQQKGQQPANIVGQPRDPSPRASARAACLAACGCLCCLMRAAARVTSPSLRLQASCSCSTTCCSSRSSRSASRDQNPSTPCQNPSTPLPSRERRRSVLVDPVPPRLQVRARQEVAADEPRLRLQEGSGGGGAATRGSCWLPSPASPLDRLPPRPRAGADAADAHPARRAAARRRGEGVPSEKTPNPSAFLCPPAR